MHVRAPRVVALALTLPGCFHPDSSGGGTETDGSTGAGTSAGTTSSTSGATTTATSSSTGATTTASTTASTTDTSDTGPADGSTTAASVTATETTVADGSTSVGCGESGGEVELDPPQLIAVQFDAIDSVRLTFSEAMSPPTGVNPQQFRMSYAHSVYVPGPNPTDYFDLGYMDQTTIAVAELDFDPCQPEELVLMLDGDLSMNVCDIVASWFDAMGQEEGAIFVHFSSGGLPGANPVEDLAGNDLADISAQWVLTPMNHLQLGTYNGHFPYMVPKLPIACP